VHLLIITLYIFPIKLGDMKNPLNTPDLRKNLAGPSITIYRNRGRMVYSVRGALVWALGFNSGTVLCIIWDSSVSIVTRLWTKHLRNHLVSIRG